MTILDRLRIFFAYYCNGRTIADISVEYSLAESTTFDIICLVENDLLADERFHLPSKLALLKGNIESVVIDATENALKKNNEISTPAKRNVIS